MGFHSWEIILLFTLIYSFAPYGRRNTAPSNLKHVHALILETCNYVTLCGKRDFADIIKVTDLPIEGLFRWSKLLTWAVREDQILWLEVEMWWKGKSESRYEEASSSKVSQRENVDFDPTITRDWIEQTAWSSLKTHSSLDPLDKKPGWSILYFDLVRSRRKEPLSPYISLTYGNMR